MMYHLKVFEDRGNFLRFYDAIGMSFIHSIFPTMLDDIENSPPRHVHFEIREIAETKYGWKAR
jgi:hypothetical protein